MKESNKPTPTYGWIKVEDRLPEIGQNVICWTDLDCMSFGELLEQKNADGFICCFALHGIGQSLNVTHWRIIEPPKD